MQIRYFFFIYILGNIGCALLGAQTGDGLVPVSAEHIVTRPVINVRSHPTHVRHDTKNRHDLYQTTQLLLGERVVVHDQRGDWARVSIPEQPVFSAKNQKIIPCPGWVEKNALTPLARAQSIAGYIDVTWAPVFEHRARTDAPCMYLSLGTPVQGHAHDDIWWHLYLPHEKTAWIERRHIKMLPEQPRRGQSSKKRVTEDEIRRALIKRATLCVGYPYVLGGRSMYNRHLQDVRTSVDCSSLVHLVYQAQGIAIPRNTLGQYHTAHKISGASCKPGDLIFLAYKKDPERIFHVMIYLGNDHLIEASGDSMNVRVIACMKKFGVPIASLKNGDTSGMYVVYFGRYL